MKAQSQPWGELSSYPLLDRVWVGNFSGRVEVNPKHEFETSRYGKLEWKFENGSVVKKGDVVAWQASEQVRHSQEQLRLLEEEHRLKMAATEWSQLERVTSLRRAAEELQSQLRAMELTDQERDVVGEEFVARLDKRRQEIAKQVDAAQKRLDPDRLVAELEIEQQRLVNELEKSRLDHAELVHNMSMIAPHDGVLEQLEEGTVRQGELIGSIERVGRAVVSVKLLDPEIRSEQPDKLAILVTDTSGRRVAGSFTHIEKLLDVGLANVIHHFKLEAGEGQELDSELSGERMVSVYRLLDRKARVVPKSKFLFAEPEKIQDLGWKAYIAKIWPEAEILYIGPTVIAIAERP